LLIWLVICPKVELLILVTGLPKYTVLVAFSASVAYLLHVNYAVLACRTGEFGNCVSIISLASSAIGVRRRRLVLRSIR